METKLITLGRLLHEHPPAVLVKAIEKHGLYGWDQYGIWGEFKSKSHTTQLALEKLSEVYYAIVESDRHDPPKSWHSVLTGKNLIGPLHHLGWLQGQLPDFGKIHRELSGTPSFMPISSPKMRDTTSHAIIGGLLELAKEQALHINPKKPLTQDQIIEALTKKYASGFSGISKSNLENVFSAANTFIQTYTGKDVAQRKPKRKTLSNPN